MTLAGTSCCQLPPVKLRLTHHLRSLPLCRQHHVQQCFINLDHFDHHRLCCASLGSSVATPPQSQFVVIPTTRLCFAPPLASTFSSLPNEYSDAIGAHPPIPFSRRLCGRPPIILFKSFGKSSTPTPVQFIPHKVAVRTGILCLSCHRITTWHERGMLSLSLILAISRSTSSVRHRHKSPKPTGNTPRASPNTSGTQM